jgi:hypothetical protein
VAWRRTVARKLRPECPLSYVQVMVIGFKPKAVAAAI